jgi:capsular polysaccharide transport system permease protein
MTLEAIRQQPAVVPGALSAPPSGPQPAPLPAAGPQILHRRHRRIAWSFVLCLLLPLLGIAGYLWGFARDQYVSTMSFSVRSEGVQSAADLLGGIGSMTGGSPDDAAIIRQFLESAELVRTLDRQEGLSQVFAAGWPGDFAFAYNPGGTPEDLHQHWLRSTQADTTGGLITLSLRSYDAERSRDILLAAFEASRMLISRLSKDAREDATRFTREDLWRAEMRLQAAREAMARFRLRSGIVDPAATLQAETAILTALQAELTEALVEQELLSRTARENHPHMRDLERRISALEVRIAAQQRKFSTGSPEPQNQDLARQFTDYESLAAEREFAEESYRAAMAAHDLALAEAKRASRYLAMHVRPVAAARGQFPDRPVQLAVAGLFLLLSWSVGLLIYYSIRDRR